MPRERQGTARKRRTREHVIADLGVHHVEGPILRCGFCVERVVHDYGLDLYMTTYTPGGQAESDWVLFQVKATDRLPLVSAGAIVSWPVSRRDLKLWLPEAYPVVLVVYDGQKDKAYWLSIHDYFADQPSAVLFAAGEWINVHIPLSNRLDRRFIRKIARTKNEIHRQFERKVHGHV